MAKVPKEQKLLHVLQSGFLSSKGKQKRRKGKLVHVQERNEQKSIRKYRNGAPPKSQA